MWWLVGVMAALVLIVPLVRAFTRGGPDLGTVSAAWLARQKLDRGNSGS